MSSLSSSVVGLTLTVLLVGGCASGARVLMPTPNLYADEQGDAFAKLAQPLKSSEVRLVYITDREPEASRAGQAS